MAETTERIFIDLVDKSDDTKDYCLGCLCDKNMRTLSYYTFLCDTTKDIFKTQGITLCYLCKRMAQHAEFFIQNVQSNQIFLENFSNAMTDSLISVRLQTQPLVNLEQVSGNVIDNLTKNCDATEETTSVFSSNILIKMEVKEESDLIEIKEETDLLEITLGDLINKDNESQDMFVKDEDQFPLNPILKKEFENENSDYLENNDDSDLLMLQHSIKKKSNIKKSKKRRRKDVARIKLIYVTKKECMEERLKMAERKKYLNCLYKCSDCIKGFVCKNTFVKHMEKHSQTNGVYECDICKQRMNTKEKLASHLRYHEVRYKCLECGLIRNYKESIEDHYTSKHLGDTRQHICTHCFKAFKQSASLRRHLSLVHSTKERVQCAYCKRTYSSKDSLRTHMMIKHSKEISAEEVTKKYVCSVCGLAFTTPSRLKYHSIKHSDARDFYCVECDKSFKSEYILKNHLKTALIHVNYKELPLACSHCDKRFSSQRDVTRHTNRIHLNVKPYECDKCDKAYVNLWSLNEHKKSTHEGYKRPLRYPCPMCDKIFLRNHILKNHIRVHTGERPYQCPKCPANFNQASILRTDRKSVV